MFASPGHLWRTQTCYDLRSKTRAATAGGSPRELRRHKLSELESGIYKPAGLKPKGRTLGILKRLMRKYKALRRHLVTDR